MNWQATSLVVKQMLHYLGKGTRALKVWPSRSQRTLMPRRSIVRISALETVMPTTPFTIATVASAWSAFIWPATGAENWNTGSGEADTYSSAEICVINQPPQPFIRSCPSQQAMNVSNVGSVAGIQSLGGLYKWA